jgi:hypothetical protein
MLTKTLQAELMKAHLDIVGRDQDILDLRRHLGMEKERGASARGSNR